ncbi:1,4-dihydroxy-2-naphthoate polyprenyltransferase [Erwiniaceae bacterium CAU 1747]
MTDNSQLATPISHPQAWIESLRPRTLPLSCASIITGSALAWWQGSFNLTTALLALLTTVLLQILSNLANDYGDAVKGSDTPARIGPLRGMQRGVITQQQMRMAMAVAVVLSMLSGILLLLRSCKTLNDMLGFILLGALAIVAAIAYTVGRKPYGYLGLGDVSVMIFFGWLGVIGSWYLQTHQLTLLPLLPATGCGLMATAVLNANNMRDIENDSKNGKYTLAVRLGPGRARHYHVMLLLGAIGCFALFTLLYNPHPFGGLFLLAAPLLWQQARYVQQESTAIAMRPLLVRTVKTALLINVLFAVGLLLS